MTATGSKCEHILLRELGSIDLAIAYAQKMGRRFRRDRLYDTASEYEAAERVLLGWKKREEDDDRQA